jgi:hypothetical protein
VVRLRAVFFEGGRFYAKSNSSSTVDKTFSFNLSYFSLLPRIFNVKLWNVEICLRSCVVIQSHNNYKGDYYNKSSPPASHFKDVSTDMNC